MPYYSRFTAPRYARRTAAGAAADLFYGLNKSTRPTTSLPPARKGARSGFREGGKRLSIQSRRVNRATDSGKTRQPFAECVTDLLDRDANNAVKKDRVGFVIAVKAIGPGLVVGNRAALPAMREGSQSPRRTDVVFRARSAECGQVGIAIEEKLDLALAPPCQAIRGAVRRLRRYWSPETALGLQRAAKSRSQCAASSDSRAESGCENTAYPARALADGVIHVVKKHRDVGCGLVRQNQTHSAAKWHRQRRAKTTALGIREKRALERRRSSPNRRRKNRPAGR